MKKKLLIFILLISLTISACACKCNFFSGNKQDQTALLISEVTDKKIGDAPFTLTTTGGSGTGAVTFTQTEGYSSATVSANGAVTLFTAGTLKVTATKAGDDTYNPITSDEIMITIAKGTGSASVSIANWISGKTPSEPVPLSETNGIYNVTYFYKLQSADDSDYTNVKPDIVGSYTIKAVFAATG